MNPFNSLGHYCGIVGVFSPVAENIPEQLFYGLFALQHRGQESAGIAYRNHGRLVVYKDLGKVPDVLTKYLEEPKESTLGIGHVRYSTQGGNRIENAQPILVSCNKGDIALAHNGTLSNSDKVKGELSGEGSIFQSTSDSELILHLIARSRQDNFYSALKESITKLEGAFSIVMAHGDALYAIRDPQGFRPLYYGKDSKGRVVVASESCALDTLGIKGSQPVPPGSILKIDKNGIQEDSFSEPQRHSHCVFELIYFARPDSHIFGKSVHMMRKRMGAALADIDPVKGEMVVPVPDSGNIAAIGYAEKSGLPLDMGLSRNHFAGRSFIMPTTAQREFAVRMKLHPVREAIEGKRIILIDDSLVRGTTAKIIVKLLREAGAKEIHLRLSAPELKWPCFFGIDIPTRKELISNSMTPDQIAEYTGADSVIFLPLEKLHKCVDNHQDFCFACFNGQYPVKIDPERIDTEKGCCG